MGSKRTEGELEIAERQLLGFYSEEKQRNEDVARGEHGRGSLLLFFSWVSLKHVSMMMGIIQWRGKIGDDGQLQE